MIWASNEVLPTQKLEEIKFWTTFILGIFRVSIWNFKFWAVKIELSFVESFFSLLSLFPSPSLRLPSVLLQLATRLPAHAVVCSLVLASSSSLSQAGRLLSSSSPWLGPFSSSYSSHWPSSSSSMSAGQIRRPHLLPLRFRAPKPSSPLPLLLARLWRQLRPPMRLEFHISWPLGTSWQLPVTLLVNSIFPATRGTTTYACVSSTPVPAAQDAPTRWLLHVLVLLPSTSVGNRSISFLSLCSCSCD